MEKLASTWASLAAIGTVGLNRNDDAHPNACLNMNAFYMHGFAFESMYTWRHILICIITHIKIFIWVNRQQLRFDSSLYKKIPFTTLKTRFQAKGFGLAFSQSPSFLFTRMWGGRRNNQSWELTTCLQSEVIQPRHKFSASVTIRPKSL